MEGKSYNPFVKVPLDEEIVISGIAGRFPNADNMKELQENLFNMIDLGSSDNRRWDIVHYDMPNRLGMSNNVDKFDAQYFDISSVEAHTTDPLCRMLLEHTYEALIDAGVNPEKLRGTKTGVFIGSCYPATLNVLLYHNAEVAGFPIIGCGKHWQVNSISNWLGLTGPSYIVDMACSSSHFAIAEAYRMIRGGECDAAIVGSSNLCLHPNETYQFFHLGVLSADGYCKPFDATGTLVGDPVEINAIDQALCSRRTTPLLLGSVKSNLGHSEPTSSLCQVAKALIAMETGIIPPNIYYETPRKELMPIIEGRIKIVTEPTSWNGGYIGISSFGFGGANGHILLKSNPENKIDIKTLGDLPRLVAVSGRTEEAVQTLLDDLSLTKDDAEYIALLHSIHAKDIEGHPYRGYTIAGSEVTVNQIRKVGNCISPKRPICFVLPGTEVKWRNVELMKLSVFAKAIEKCNEILKQRDIYVMDIIMNDNKTTSNNIVTSFVAIIATQIGIVDLLTHVGILPDYTIGHSIGQLICEYVDGRFTVEKTILAAYYIGTAFEQAKSQIEDITTNRGSYIDILRSKLIEHLNRILLAEPSNSRGVTQLGRSRSKRDMFETAVEYYADGILNPIPLRNIIPFLPKDTILVDIIPHNAVQSIMKNSVESIITLISLYKSGEEHTLQDFLEGIGDLYSVGLQPQIASLYPPVEFPVSRGTPMISPLIRWDHSEDYLLYRYVGEPKIYSRVRVVNITTSEEDFEYMSGHIIDGKNLLPAMGYLYEIWYTIGLLSGIDRSNNFEIIKGGNVIVSGVVRIPDNIANEKLLVHFLPKDDDAKECMNTADIAVHVYDSFDAIVSGGIEIYGLKAMAISRRVIHAQPVHEEYKFIAYRGHNTISLKDAILLEDLVTPIVHKVLCNLSLVRPNLTLVATENRYDSSLLPSNVSIIQHNEVLKGDTFLMVVGVRVLTKDARTLLSNVMPGGFLFIREDLNATYDNELLQQYNLDIILEKRMERESVLLLRKAQSAIIRREIVHINNYEFSWIGKLKSVMDADNETNSRVILVTEDNPECGVLGLVNCLRREPGGDTVRCVFIQDKDAPKFSLQEPFYMNQLRLDLPINVLRPGEVWGSYRHLSVPSLEPIPVQYGYVAQRIRGDMSTLRWLEGETSSKIKHENIIRIIYTTLNFKDIMIVNGKLELKSFQTFARNIDSLLGMEFVGYNESGQRIMGLCRNRGISNVIYGYFMSWVIPDEWTFEDAATVPCVYATSYYALYQKGKIKKRDKVLIHSGTGGVGQAAIHLALYEGCEVFTTVGTLEKRQFIRETFPSIPDDHIGNSRDTTFEQMILQQTCGRGVDIVLNSLADEKLLEASVRCLAKGGRFLEIGNYDLIVDNTLDIMVFAKGISFHAIMLDNVINSVTMKEVIYNYILHGLKNGTIKPLPRKVFEKIEVEAAFRYMAAHRKGNFSGRLKIHVFSILIKMRDENEPLDLPILAYPRFFCKSHMSYVILGGLGGFGLELADWLILRGAKNLLLTSRDCDAGLRNGYQRSRVELWKSYGVNVQIIAGVEASDHKDGAFILKTAVEMGPVDAIFNFAVVLKDSLYQNQTTESFEETFKPKAMATKTMDKLSRKMCPDLRYFVVFSSVSCGRGNAGQTNYGMANSIMERICERRVQDGLPGMAIQWGAVGDVGLVADMQEDNKELIIGGTLQQKIQSCLQSLDTFMMLNRPIVGSMVVAEKRAELGGVMDILETNASIISNLL
ncbi:LOW QUALITY PROTEIN: fatty acid synthase-like [Harpegnathos saltator]|uniref:LOW QUALITY PROTEIN: fatty acid synthase-like n=1 Tax=Harpegnathos saltator TaxID=610380 RepID=UPI000DBEEAC4|nr:LOW QUALITY PROTEIN: fatty acid synthase-like [Harpegnathos saltator]